MLKLYDFNWKNYTFQALKQLPREKFKIATKFGIQKLEFRHYNWTLALSVFTHAVGLSWSVLTFDVLYIDLHY